MSILDYFRRPSELDRAREQLELAETRARLAVVQAQERLVSEAVSSNDPRWRSSWEGPSQYRQHTPTDAPLQIFSLTDRTSEDGLAAIRQRSRALCEENPFAIGALDNLENFLVGDGNKYTASTKDEASAPLVAAVQDVLDEFGERTIWPEWEIELVRRRARDGEYFLRFFEANGRLDLRVVEPEWVKNPENANTDEWQHGCKLDPDDKGGAPLAYWVVYPGEQGEEIPAAEIQHVKANVDRNALRGLPDFFAPANVLDAVGRLLNNMTEGETIRAAIAGFWEYENASAAAVAAHIGATKDALQQRGNSPDPITGKSSNFQRIEPGTFIHVPKGKKHLPPPASPASTQQVSIEQAGLRAVGVRWNMPEYMVSGDSSNANFASTLVSGAPFSRAVRKAQGFLKRRHLKTMWRAVKAAADANLISVGGRTLSFAEVKSVIEIQAEATPPEIANELELSQVDSADMAAGVLSKQTRAMRRGLDWEQEKKNLADDPPTVPGMGAVDPFAPPLPDEPAPAETPDPDEQAGAVAGNDLRTTVGGLNAVASLQSQYYAGKLPREAAIANVKVLLGFTDSEAASLFPEIAPVKLTPDDAAAAPEVAPPTLEHLVSEADDDSSGVKAAKDAVAAALKSGKLEKKPCAECGDKDVEAHHKDYRKPLNVTWLCRRCHDRRHGKDVGESVATASQLTEALTTANADLASRHGPELAKAVIAVVAGIIAK